MGFRLLILGVMGLGAMYMMHLLAQDYDRIRRPVTKAIERALRGKRDLETNEVVEMSVDWKRVLDRDPFSCLQSLICQIMSGSQANDSEAIKFTRFLQLTYRGAPSSVQSAYAKGVAFSGITEHCISEYPWCWYSAGTMLKLLRWFA